MLWFNEHQNLVKEPQKSFQYILCCGSTRASEMGISKNGYFNTSYVVVQRWTGTAANNVIFNFNTSYVVVQLK